MKQATLAKRDVNRNVDAVWLAVAAVASEGLGQHDASIAVARKAVELIPESNDAFEGPYWQDPLAQMAVMDGDAIHALRMIAHLIGTNASTTTIAMLKRDPVRNPLRTDPGLAKRVRGDPGQCR